MMNKVKFTGLTVADVEENKHLLCLATLILTVPKNLRPKTNAMDLVEKCQVRFIKTFGGPE